MNNLVLSNRVPASWRTECKPLETHRSISQCEDSPLFQFIANLNLLKPKVILCIFNIVYMYNIVLLYYKQDTILDLCSVLYFLPYRASIALLRKLSLWLLLSSWRQKEKMDSRMTVLNDSRPKDY